jgi:2-methylcitrate dehydratase PrpD
MNGLRQLAAYNAGLGGAIDANIRAKLALHVADTVAAWAAATHTPEGKAVIAFRRRQQQATTTDDLVAHCALVRLSEIDDIHLASMTTCGSIVIPAALTLAGADNAGEIAPAILAGYEAMIRLGLAIKGPEVLYRGIWPTYFAAGFGAAAVAARLLRLDAQQTAQALALALTWASPSVGQHHAVTTGRWLSVGIAARNGLSAARAAQAGFTADLDVLQSRLLPDIYGITPDLAAMRDGAQPAFAQVSLKPWCAARQTMPATQALREVLAQGVTPAAITAIKAYVLPPHLKMIDHGVKDGDRGAYVTSLQYQMAVAALQSERNLDLDQHMTPPTPALRDFMARVSVSGDEALLADYPAAWPARVVVETVSGPREQRVTSIPGDPPRAFTQADVAAKFHRLVAPVAGAAKAQRLFDGAIALIDTPSALPSLRAELDVLMTSAVAV